MEAVEAVEVKTPDEVTHGAYESPKCPLQLPVYKDMDTYRNIRKYDVYPQSLTKCSKCSNQILRMSGTTSISKYRHSALWLLVWGGVINF